MAKNRVASELFKFAGLKEVQFIEKVTAESEAQEVAESEVKTEAETEAESEPEIKAEPETEESSEPEAWYQPKIFREAKSFSSSQILYTLTGFLYMLSGISGLPATDSFWKL